MFSIRQRVVIKDTHQLGPGRFKTVLGVKGSVVGTGCEIRQDGQIVTLILVRLDVGFYNPDKTGYVSILAVHPDCLIEDN